MNESVRAIGRYCDIVARHSTAVVITGFVPAVIGIVSLVFEFTPGLPWPAWIAAGIVALVVAQFRAWCDLEQQRDAAHAELQAHASRSAPPNFQVEPFELVRLDNVPMRGRLVEAVHLIRLKVTSDRPCTAQADLVRTEPACPRGGPEVPWSIAWRHGFKREFEPVPGVPELLLVGHVPISNEPGSLWAHVHRDMGRLRAHRLPRLARDVGRH